MSEKGYDRLSLSPVSLDEARAFVAAIHRHNDPPVGHKVSVGIRDQHDVLRGVGMMGRPVARNADDGRTLEIIRVATDGVRNGCSMLYGALVRVAWNLGYTRVLTYTLDDESGASLRASGWTADGISMGGQWKRSNGDPRALDRPVLFYPPKMPTQAKQRWVIEKERKA